jgi:curved DNA-binding protein CbpA
MRDPYTVLGVTRSASEAEVKKAFRRLAKEHHPDRNANDPKAKERFSELNGAYEIVGDANKRAQFDRGEIGADGKPKFQGFDGFSGARRGGFEGGSDPFGGRGGFNPSDVFGDLFGDAMRRGGSTGTRAHPKGQDIEATLTVTLADIATGATKRLKLPTGREVEVGVPRSVVDGKVIRLKGLGHPSPFAGEPGDVLLTAIALAAVDTALWDLRGRRLGVPLWRLAGGAQQRVPRVGGKPMPRQFGLAATPVVDDALPAREGPGGGAETQGRRQALREPLPFGAGRRRAHPGRSRRRIAGAGLQAGREQIRLADAAHGRIDTVILRSRVLIPGPRAPSPPADGAVRRRASSACRGAA